MESWRELQQQLGDLESGIALSKESGELWNELPQLKHVVDEHIVALELRILLNGPHDANNALLVLHAGAGGAEAADWAGMLLRMYQRWAEDNGFDSQLLDAQTGEEAGLKSATLQVNSAYGRLRTEIGVHRLVRISPFDANKRRHTSFASVFVYPDVADEIDIKVKETELKIDTFRAQGAGGQHVNTTDSAVRITHLPSGIVVQCQSERSQHKNRAFALKVLKARLYNLERERLEEEKKKRDTQKRQIAWGSQIRSYVLHPYQLVKDHRTQHQTTNAERVLNGELNDFIQQALLKNS